MRRVMIAAAVLMAGCGAESEQVQCRVSLVGSYAYAVRMADNLPCESWPCRVQIDTELDNPCDGAATLSQSITCGEQQGSFGPDCLHAVEHNAISGEFTADAACSPRGVVTVEQNGESYEIAFASEVRWAPK